MIRSFQCFATRRFVAGATTAALVASLSACGDQGPVAETDFTAVVDDTLEENAGGDDYCAAEAPYVVSTCEPQGPGIAADAACDMNGVWIAESRTLTVAVNEAVQQAGHTLFYYEIEQHGTDTLTTKLLRCGVRISDAGGSLETGIEMVTPVLWDAVMGKNRYGCLQGTYAMGDSACDGDFGILWLVRGLSPHFLDPSTDLEGLTQSDSADWPGTPGWEDWDEDGKPGITLTATGIANFDMHVGQRGWNHVHGTTEGSAGHFRMPVDWEQSQVILSTTPPDFPVPPQLQAPAPRPFEHYQIFHKLDEAMLKKLGELVDRAGDDLDAADRAICAQVRTWSPTWLAEAEPGSDPTASPVDP